MGFRTLTAAAASSVLRHRPSRLAGTSQSPIHPPIWTKVPTNTMPLGAQLNPAILGDCDSWNMPVKVSWATKLPNQGSPTTDTAITKDRRTPPITSRTSCSREPPGW